MDRDASKDHSRPSVFLLRWQAVITSKGTIKHSLGLTGLPHTHHAGEDAAELAAVFDAVLARSKGKSE